MSRRKGVWVVVLVLVLIAAGLGVHRWTRAPEVSAAPVRRPAPTAAAPVPRSRTAAAAPEIPADPEEIRCDVGRALEGRACQLLIANPEVDDRFHVTSFTYDGAAVGFVPNPEVRSAVLRCPDVDPPLHLSWADDGACLITGTLPAPADAPLSGRVRGAADLPEGTVFLEGCGAQGDDPVDADGSFFVQTTPGHCSMRAWRQAGALRLPGPWTEVDAVSGVDVEVDLAVPTFAPAGMGIGFRPMDDGIGVTGVRSGSPAEVAGISEGDVILRIDGAPTEEMDIEGFLQAGIGPEGSAVHLEGTTAEGEPFEVTLTRRPIDPG